MVRIGGRGLMQGGRFCMTSNLVDSAGTQSSTGSHGAASMVSVRSLEKNYGSLRAVDGVSFEVARGEIFGLLGPNGAGKTTCLEMMEGLRRPDAGTITISGISVWPDPTKVKRLIGVQTQSTAFYEELTVQEVLRLFSALHGRRLPKRAIEDLLDLSGLAEKRKAYTLALSGGQKQRLAIAIALVNEPELVFLDEPTTGLDPQARRRTWEVVKELRDRGKTIILSSHYMEEAEYLCDRLAIIDYGKIIAMDTPARLVGQLGRKARISFTASRPIEGTSLGLAGSEVGAPHSEGEQTLLAENLDDAITVLLRTAHDQDIEIKNLQVRTANLEDVFLTLTGKELRD